ncbi:MAG: hypothetical protein AAGA66_12145, partial [Bacteroidota bacterium]
MRKIISLCLLIFLLGACTNESELPHPQVDEFQDSEQAVQSEENVPTHITYASSNGARNGRVKSDELLYYNDIDLSQTILEFNFRGVMRKVAMFNQRALQVGYIDESRFDIAPEDGWRLLYNWIPTNKEAECQVPAMLFYNKYSGKLKLFYRHMDSNTTSGNLMASLFTQYDNLLFKNEPIIYSDYTKKYQASIVSQSAELLPESSNLGLIPDHWYAFEWDASGYDPDVLPGDFLTISGWAAHFENIDLSGTINGDASGFVRAVATRSDYNSIVSTKDLKKASSNLISSGVTKVFGSKIKKFFKNKASKASKRGAKPLEKLFTSLS